MHAAIRIFCVYACVYSVCSFYLRTFIRYKIKCGLFISISKIIKTQITVNMNKLCFKNLYDYIRYEINVNET